MRTKLARFLLHAAFGVGLCATTATLAISGRVDRVDDRGDELVVVDYKTGRRGLTDDDARGSQALALYVLAVRRTMRRACLISSSLTR